MMEAHGRYFPTNRVINWRLAGVWPSEFSTRIATAYFPMLFPSMSSTKISARLIDRIENGAQEGVTLPTPKEFPQMKSQIESVSAIQIPRSLSEARRRRVEGQISQ